MITSCDGVFRLRPALIVSLIRLLIYGQYCSHMENAQKTLDELIATREDVKIKVEVHTHTHTPVTLQNVFL